MIRPATIAAAIAIVSHPAAAQHDMSMHHAPGRLLKADLGASAIVLGSHVDPAVTGRRFRELYLTQPLLHANLSALHGHLAVSSVVDLEGLTLRRGELAPGAWGEGYADRRHPHTYLHELVGAVMTPTVYGATLSVSGGKGFVPFGSDDPMVRPIVRYPVNHHLSQILERAMIAGALRWRGATIESALFNGDEPERPTDAPNAANFGNSAATRLTISPLRGMELQASTARVVSPELPQGHGLDHRQRHGSVRLERATPLGTGYLLAESARTDVHKAGRTAFRLHSTLAEGSLTRGRLRVAARAERTERPEEECLADPFRTIFPTGDVQVLGITRLSTMTLALASTVARHGLSFSPFVELAVTRARATTTPSAFNPRLFYGSDVIRSFSLGVSLGAGMQHARMGHYGAASASHER